MHFLSFYRTLQPNNEASLEKNLIGDAIIELKDSETIRHYMDRVGIRKSRVIKENEFGFDRSSFKILDADLAKEVEVNVTAAPMDVRPLISHRSST